MSNEEIDAAACEYAGLEPLYTPLADCNNRNCPVGCPDNHCVSEHGPFTGKEFEYPAVSSTGDGMLLLMEALKSKGIFHRVEYDSDRRVGHAYYSTVDFEKANADSAPMALALAVVELAKAKEQGS